MRINSKLVKSAIAAVVMSYSSIASAELNIFACEPEYAALAKELAPNARIYSATTAMQDPHQVQARPSLIAKMRQADIAVCAGADLEVGWLPMLQMKSSNAKVRSTDQGLFFAAEQVETIDQLKSVDRSMGDVHAQGNPHLHFSPERMLKVAQALTAKLTAVDPTSKAEYESALADFSQKWTAAIPVWEKKAAPLNGKKVIAYHSSFKYLFNWVGIEQVADLEPKPGLPPSSSHLASLLTRTEAGDVMAIIVASYQDERGANWLGERANLPVQVLPMSVGGNEQSQDLFSLYDSVLDLLLSVKAS
ncbi:ABC-type metal ion transport system, periplasmic component/surface adhesin [Shewanella psychrophila]|uniref:ABC-type metal ion transport system, periplasmic component/surface adhesin n=1 Tax=Shewanella psychrophila TaxID=225848 RepID=A0A1S6HXX5_9GAMM|nr:zinc ABC transporter substrate-binding protein [Shewanella psychrophila]AQS40361.1 ABC-type metal ion transport system, periplasmic component/surface adhesin [Shewanella psychrophila]